MTNVEAADWAVILVGHGGVPTDYPRDRLTKLRGLEARRRAAGTSPTGEEVALDAELRNWPRTPLTDPYRAGLELIADRLGPLLGGRRLVLAYNEFCAPSIETAVADLAEDGVTDITVIPAMLTPGGAHSEVDIPESLAALRTLHPKLRLRYAWPVNLDLLATMMAQQIRAFD